MFHNIPTLFEILSNNFHKIAFIYKSSMGEMSSFPLIVIYGFNLRNKTLFSLYFVFKPTIFRKFC